MPKSERRQTQNIFSIALARAAASDPTPGIVVGDLNLQEGELKEALQGVVVQRDNVDYWGGQGRFA